jgi:hypothetical protein
MVVKRNNVIVQFPGAQYLFRGDLWGCPVCDFELVIRAPRPYVEGFMPAYQAERIKADYTVFNR